MQNQFYRGIILVIVFRSFVCKKGVKISIISEPPINTGFLFFDLQWYFHVDTTQSSTNHQPEFENFEVQKERKKIRSYPEVIPSKTLYFWVGA